MLVAKNWGDPACRWRAIPSEEKDFAISQLKEKSASLFTKRGHVDMASSKVESAIRERLQSARRNWSRARRPLHRKHDKCDEGEESVQEEGAIAAADNLQDAATNDTGAANEQLAVAERRTAMDIASILRND